MFALHSPITCWLFFFFRKIIVHGCSFYTHTLLPGFRFSLAMHIFGLHSPSRCWIFKVFLFSKLIFHGVFILSLSKQVLRSHSPCRCWILTFLFFFFLNLDFSSRFTSFILSLSKQVVSSHSRYKSLVYTLRADVCFFFFYNCFSNFVCQWTKTFFWSSLNLNHFKVGVSFFFSNLKLDQSKLRWSSYTC